VNPGQALLWTLLMVGAVPPLAAQQPLPTPECRNRVIRGRVSALEAFETPITSSLMFRLDPEAMPQNPQGWTIRVSPPASPTSDYSMVATPPYRWANPRYVDTGYGISAEAALANTPRSFGFVASAEEYEAAQRALDVLLWPGTHASAEVAEAERALESVPTFAGTFHIEDGETSHASAEDALGRIEWMSFRVELCVPVE
jgi:hypothetical protein